MTITIQEAIDKLTEHASVDNSVDKLLCGDASNSINGIAVAFMASQHAVESAIALSANLLIAHESPYYSHAAPAAALEGDAVYSAKLHIIEESGLAIFRYHDYWHRYSSDGIMMGLLEALEWQSNVIEYRPAAAIVGLPAMTAEEVALYLKNKLGIPYIRLAGDVAATCRRAGVLVGYRGGGASAIALLQETDVVIAGEGPEWETPEYARDAAQQGRGKPLIMLGHAESEEPGMRFLAKRLAEQFPAVPVHFIPGEPVFKVY